jgi:site-specific DNA-methyltransferase (adenine-specific)
MSRPRGRGVGGTRVRAYYQNEWATIYHADCLTVLPQLGDGAAEIAVTSPPYNLNKNASGGGTSKRSYDGWYADEMPERSYQAWQTMVVDALTRVCRSSVFYNHRIRYAWHGRNEFRTPTNIYHPLDWLSSFPLWCEVIWNRGGTTGHANGRFRLADERVYVIGKPEKWHEHGHTTVWNIMPEREGEHPCPFPVEIPERCILAATDPNDVVIDPFMGSGSTWAACCKTGRNFVGIEQEERFCELAVKRIVHLGRDAAPLFS